MNGTPWIDASGAHRLSCALRWTSSLRPEGRRDGLAEKHSIATVPEEDTDDWSAATLGNQAHQALDEWIKASEWHEDGSGETLRQRFLAIADSNEHGIGAARLVGLNLKCRGRELSQYFRSIGCEEVLSEEFLADNDRRIRGKLDLIAISESAVYIIDLKTGKNYSRNRPLGDAARWQLAVYSILARQKWSRRSTAEILSLEDGLLGADLQDIEAESLVKALEAMREQAVAEVPPSATPSQEGCRWCDLRMQCGAHWGAVASGEIQDAMLGSVERIEVAENGIASCLIDTADGRRVITGFQNSPQLPSGVRVGAVRVRPTAEVEIWLANRSSVLAEC